MPGATPAGAAATAGVRRPAADGAPEAKRQATGAAASSSGAAAPSAAAAADVPVPTTPPTQGSKIKALIMGSAVWETEDASMLAEAVENETKRMRFTAAISLDEPIDYAPLDGLTVDMLSKISGLTDEH